MAFRKVAYRGRNIQIDYEPDKLGMARCAVGPELRDAVTRVITERALPYAIGISPVGKPPHDPHPGDYVRSFEVISDAHAVVAGMRRVAALLLNHSFHATLVEWGRDGQNEYAVLRRTLAHLNAGL